MKSLIKSLIMNKHLIFLLLISSICYSQNEVSKLIKEIDSISDLNEQYGIAEGKIDVKNSYSGNSIANGGYSVSTFVKYDDEDIYNKLSIQEKKKHKRENHTILIKGKYNEVLHYKNRQTEIRKGEFYYVNNKLVYVNIVLKKMHKTKLQLKEQYGFTPKELDEIKVIKNVFLFDIKPWIYEKNNSILKLFNHN